MRTRVSPAVRAASSDSRAWLLEVVGRSCIMKAETFELYLIDFAIDLLQDHTEIRTVPVLRGLL